MLGELNKEQVGTAGEYGAPYPNLTLNDCFALVMAESTRDAILLTGDQRLRRVAEQHGVEAHGILWLLDRAYEEGMVDAAPLHAALLALASDPLARLPGKELQLRIQKMTTITLNLPDDVYGALRKAPGDFAQELVLAATCHWYAQGQLAQDKAAEIAGLSRAEFIDELARRRIPVGQYSAEEVLEEVRRA